MRDKRRMLAVVLAWFLLLQICFPPSGAAAAAAKVVSTESELQNAIYWTSTSADIALSGSLTLSESITVYGKDIRISGQNGTAPVLTRGTWNSAAMFVVAADSTLTLENICLRGATDSYLSSLIKVEQGGKLILGEGCVLENNKIKGNTEPATYGGAIYCEAGKVCLQGGTIKNCSADSGGAVYLRGSSSFSMTGGEISGNEARRGAGVLLENFAAAAALRFTGGSVSNNSASELGGGVLLDIYPNSQKVTCELGGAISVSENKVENAPSNLCIGEGNVSVSIVSLLSGSVGLSLPSEMNGDLSGLISGSEGHNLTAQDAARLPLDDGEHCIALDEQSNKPILTDKPAQPACTLTLTGDCLCGETITVTAENPPQGAVVQIIIGETTYDSLSLTLLPEHVGKNACAVAFLSGEKIAESQGIGPIALRTLSCEVQITGEAKVGETLTASLSETPAFGGVGFVWQCSDAQSEEFTDIENAQEASLVIDEDLKGKYLRAAAIGNGYYGNTLYSDAIGPIESGQPAPTLTITGDAQIGSTLTAALEPGDPQAVIAWQRSDAQDGAFSPIDDAPGASYVVREADMGKYLRAVLSEGSVFSSAVGPIVGKKLQGEAKVSGEARVGNTLTATLEGAEALGLSYSVYWEKRESDVSAFSVVTGSSKSTYSLSLADKGAYLRPVFTGTGTTSGQIVGKEVGPILPAPPPKPALSSLEAPKPSITTKFESKEQALLVLTEKHGTISARIAGEPNPQTLAIQWSVEGEFDPERGARNRYRWTLVNAEDYHNPGGVALSGVVELQNGMLPPAVYSVTKEAGIEHGDLALGLSSASKGQWVQVLVTPRSGYELDALYRYGAEDPENPEQIEGGGFEMPEYDVVVGVRFREVPKPPVVPISGVPLREEHEDEKEGAALQHRVLCSRLNLRAGPGTEHERLGYVLKGEVLTVLTMDGDWGYAATEDGREGFVNLSYLAPQEGCLQVIARNLNVRSGPGTEQKRTGMLKRGQWVYVKAVENGWALIVFEGKDAWVSAVYLA